MHTFLGFHRRFTKRNQKATSDDNGVKLEISNRKPTRGTLITNLWVIRKKKTNKPKANRRKDNKDKIRNERNSKENNRKSVRPLHQLKLKKISSLIQSTQLINIQQDKQKFKKGRNKSTIMEMRQGISLQILPSLRG